MRSFILACLLMFNMAFAEPIELKTGHWPIDTSRMVELDTFDYAYDLKQLHARGMILELYDGSLWQVEEISAETISFYAQRKEHLDFEFIEDLVAEWQVNERLIFHKVSDRESLLVYNIDRDMLINVTPLLPPTDPFLVIEEVDRTNKKIRLSDQSIWDFIHLCACKKWSAGNPVIMVKNTPWRADHTHMIINLTPCICDSKVEHIHPNRLGVKRAE